MEASPALTLNRAATAVVRSRNYLARAENELRLALRILTEMEGPVAATPLDPPARLELMQRLERYLEKLAAVEELARSVWDEGDPRAGAIPPAGFVREERTTA